MSENNKPTVAVQSSSKTAVTIGFDSNGFPLVSIETTAPYKQTIEDAIDITLQLMDHDSEVDEDEGPEED